MDFFIFGGCVSRDAFEYDLDGELNIVDYVARSSLASALSTYLDISVNYSKISSDFQKRCVKRDVEKSFKHLLIEKQFDYLLIDLFSNRFNIAYKANDLNKSSLLTLSNEIVKSGFNVSDNGMKVVRRNTEEYFSLWKKGFDKLLSSSGVDNKKILINKIFLAKHLEDGSHFEGGFSSDVIDEYNAYLSKCYSYMSHFLGSDQFICYEDALFVGALDHKWGRSPYHFCNDFYIEAVRKLKGFKKHEGLVDKVART